MVDDWVPFFTFLIVFGSIVVAAYWTSRCPNSRKPSKGKHNGGNSQING